jgi:hypothetical protein
MTLILAHGDRDKTTLARVSECAYPVKELDIFLRRQRQNKMNDERG